MPYDASGQWYDETGGGGNPIGDLLNGVRGAMGGGQPAPQAPTRDSSYGPFDPPGYQSDAATEAAKKKADDEAFAASKTHSDAVDIATAEARLKILQQQAAEATDPEIKAAKLAEAKAAAEKTQLEIERIRSSMSPQDLAQFENDLAMARQKAQQDFSSAQDAQKHQWDATENQAQRDFTAGQNDLSRGVTLRGQEIERLKAQDDWVLGILRQQVAEGTLSLQRATSMFNAYVDRARLPSQIMESVSRAIQPFSGPDFSKNYVAPGNEKGGPTDVLARAAGVDPSTIQRNPFKDVKSVDLFKLAKKAGADFKNTSIPDPGQVFGSVPIPQTDFSQYQSALAGFPAAPFPGAAGGAPPPPSAPPPPGAGAGPAGSATPPPSWQMSDDQIARLNSLLDGAAAQP